MQENRAVGDENDWPHSWLVYPKVLSGCPDVLSDADVTNRQSRGIIGEAYSWKLRKEIPQSGITYWRLRCNDGARRSVIFTVHYLLFTFSVLTTHDLMFTFALFACPSGRRAPRIFCGITFHIVLTTQQLGTHNSIV
jgi:hypothetical protein